MRRFGMFTAMQFYNLAAYDEVWDGNKKHLHFGAKVEYGKLAVSTFAIAEDWRYVDDDERRDVIRRILKDECDAVIRQIRTVTSVSPLTLWENIFGFLLWQYHVLLSNPGTSEEARADLRYVERRCTLGRNRTSFFICHLLKRMRAVRTFEHRSPHDMLLL